MWRKARVGEIERRAAAVLPANVPDMPVRWVADEPVCADVVLLARALDHPVCDCVYLALAHRIGAVMLMADGRFANAVAPTEHGESLMTLADYAEIALKVRDGMISTPGSCIPTSAWDHRARLPIAADNAVADG